VKKDIEIPVVKDVYVAIAHEWNKEFLSKDWNAYIINGGSIPIEMALIVSKGFDGERKTSLMRHAIAVVPANSFEKIEVVQEDVLALNNEFFVTYYIGNTLYEKRFLFEKGSVSKAALIPVPVLGQDGVMAK
jgi:hypothetical protein